MNEALGKSASKEIEGVHLHFGTFLAFRRTLCIFICMVSMYIKFYGLKHKPLLCPAPDWLKALDREQRMYKSALEECREANREFHKEMINYILNVPATFTVTT